MMIRYLAHGVAPRITDKPLAKFRLHPASKTVSQSSSFVEEQLETLHHVAKHGPRDLQSLARSHLRRMEWGKELDDMQECADRERRLARGIYILRRMLAHPRDRVGRASLRALARVLLSND